jgi:hypothetical protein
MDREGFNLRGSCKALHFMSNGASVTKVWKRAQSGPEYGGLGVPARPYSLLKNSNSDV